MGGEVEAAWRSPENDAGEIKFLPCIRTISDLTDFDEPDGDSRPDKLKLDLPQTSCCQDADACGFKAGGCNLNKSEGSQPDHSCIGNGTQSQSTARTMRGCGSLASASPGGSGVQPRGRSGQAAVGKASSKAASRERRGAGGLGNLRFSQSSQRATSNDGLPTKRASSSVTVATNGDANDFRSHGLPLAAASSTMSVTNGRFTPTSPPTVRRQSSAQGHNDASQATVSRGRQRFGQTFQPLARTSVQRENPQGFVRAGARSASPAAKHTEASQASRLSRDEVLSMSGGSADLQGQISVVPSVAPEMPAASISSSALATSGAATAAAEALAAAKAALVACTDARSRTQKASSAVFDQTETNGITSAQASVLLSVRVPTPAAEVCKPEERQPLGPPKDPPSVQHWQQPTQQEQRLIPQQPVLLQRPLQPHRLQAPAQQSLQTHPPRQIQEHQRRASATAPHVMSPRNVETAGSWVSPVRGRPNSPVAATASHSRPSFRESTLTSTVPEGFDSRTAAPSKLISVAMPTVTVQSRQKASSVGNRVVHSQVAVLSAGTPLSATSTSRPRAINRSGVVHTGACRVGVGSPIPVNSPISLLAGAVLQKHGGITTTDFASQAQADAAAQLMNMYGAASADPLSRSMSMHGVPKLPNFTGVGSFVSAPRGHSFAAPAPRGLSFTARSPPTTVIVGGPPTGRTTQQIQVGGHRLAASSPPPPQVAVVPRTVGNFRSPPPSFRG